MTAIDDLIDHLAARIFGSLPVSDGVVDESDCRAAAIGVLDGLARPGRRQTVVRWLVDTVGTDPLIGALVDAVGPGNLVAAMVAEGVLVVNTVHLRDGTPKTYRLADQETGRG